ncbi:MAG: BspA family leucine-rich repeat surface protein [Prevotella sp.]|nr:BspA family leucine-rich repeat surface protein [Prevotella sp.]
MTVGTTTTGGPDSAAKVENSGTDVDIVLDFTIPQGPKGDTGETGKSATIAVGQVTTGRPGTEVMIVNAGNENHGIFDFTIPQGEKGDKGDTGERGIQGETGVAATIEIGTVTTGAAGTTARVSNVGTETAAIFNFTIPQGEKGDKGDTGDTGLGIESIEQTESSTESSGKNTMTVTLTDGTTSTFDVYNGARGATGDPGPQGEKGEKGDPGESGSTGATGESATIEIGETTTGDAGTEAQVINSGTSTNAILNFTIPKGDQGEQGIQGEMGPQGDVGPQGEAAKVNAGAVIFYSLDDYDTDEGEPEDGAYPGYVVNTGTSTNATFDFYLPQTNSATIEVGAVSYGDVLTIENAGSSTNALFDFTFPSTLTADYDEDTKTLTLLFSDSVTKISGFAVYCEDDGSLTFYGASSIPGEGTEYNNKNITEIYRRVDTASYISENNVPWRDVAEEITSVIFDESFAQITPASTAYWLANLINCTSVSGFINIDTSQVSVMDNMFYNCSSFITLDISDLNTQNVMSMDSMFEGCENLVTIYSNDNVFNVDQVEYSDAMFDGCESLVGGNGTTYNEEQIDASMAHIDTADNPGYFTAK